MLKPRLTLLFNRDECAVPNIQTKQPANSMNSRALTSVHRYGSESLGAFDLADVMLRIQLDAELLHQMQLRFEEVDVVLLVLHQLLEEVAGHVVARAVAMGRRLLVKRAR